MNILRRKARIVKIGNLYIGGNHPIAIQSMAKTRTADIHRTTTQIKRLEKAGCEIVRVAIKDSADAKALKKIKSEINIPLVADIHFDWQLALTAIDNGADKIRLNPGNIYKKEEIRDVALAARQARIPIRVGVNSGSVGQLASWPATAEWRGAVKGGIGQFNRQTELMVHSAMNYIKILEKEKFYDIVISLKASNVLDTIEAYRKIAVFCDYPLHLGVTATGLPQYGIIKSSIAIGALLTEGIGDTIRVSLTDKPEEEISAAKNILAALGLRRFGPEIISCPTCGRCQVDLVKIVKELESSFLTGKPANRQTGKPIKVAVMGCEVNGPGEAREADIGIAFGKKEGLLFKRGRPERKVSFMNCANVLLEELEKE